MWVGVGMGCVWGESGAWGNYGWVTWVYFLHHVSIIPASVLDDFGLIPECPPKPKHERIKYNSITIYHQ